MHRLRLENKDKVVLYLEKLTSNQFEKIYCLSKKDG